MPASPSVIDAHHHLWRYSAIEYEWIDDRMATLRRDFLPADFIDGLTKTGIDGAVTVQARQTLEETQWLLKLASKHKQSVRVGLGDAIASIYFVTSLHTL